MDFNSYEIDSSMGTIHSAAIVIATGGLSIPKIGATDFGYRVAKQFDLPIVTPRPALVPLSFDTETWAPFVPLAGASLAVDIATGSARRKTKCPSIRAVFGAGRGSPTLPNRRAMPRRPAARLCARLWRTIHLHLIRCANCPLPSAPLLNAKQVINRCLAPVFLGMR